MLPSSFLVVAAFDGVKNYSGNSFFDEWDSAASVESAATTASAASVFSQASSRRHLAWRRPCPRAAITRAASIPPPSEGKAFLVLLFFFDLIPVFQPK
jgi:hypothetical protein